MGTSRLGPSGLSIERGRLVERLRYRGCRPGEEVVVYEDPTITSWHPRLGGVKYVAAVVARDRRGRERVLDATYVSHETYVAHRRRALEV